MVGIELLSFLPSNFLGLQRYLKENSFQRASSKNFVGKQGDLGVSGAWGQGSGAGDRGSGVRDNGSGNRTKDSVATRAFAEYTYPGPALFPGKEAKGHHWEAQDRPS